jgi:hypothetical protein
LGSAADEGAVTSRYSTPPDAAKLEESTSRLKLSLDGLAASSTPIAPTPVATETEFFAALRARLKLGQVTYGDKSFEREPSELLGELELEALDLAGWGYVLWRRVRLLRAAVGEAEKAGGRDERAVKERG